MNIGKKIQKIRKDKGLSLDELAERSSLAKATLSKIENGRTSGTMKTHLKIAQGLGISLGELYLEIEREEREDLAFAPSAEEVEVKSYSFDEKSYFTILTTGNILKNKMLPVVYTIEPGGSTISQVRPAEEKPLGSERLIFVLKGEVEAVINNKQYHITEGSFLYFKAHLPHFFKNMGKDTAKFFCVTSPAVL
jgi:transcriptional regulator with XRE-family HTH domain